MGATRNKFLDKIHNMSVEELRTELNKLKAYLMKLNMKSGKSTSSRGYAQRKQVMLIHNTRKNIARINTEIRMRENGRRKTGERIHGKISRRFKH